LEQLQQLLSPDLSFKKLRETMHNLDPPCVPHIGLYLSDLTFIDEGNPDFLLIDNHDHVNFDKFLLVAKVIGEIQLFQQVEYSNIQVDQRIQAFLTFIHAILDSDILFEISLEIEPKC